MEHVIAMVSKSTDEKNGQLSLGAFALGITWIFLVLLSYMLLRNMEWKSLNTSLKLTWKM